MIDNPLVSVIIVTWNRKDDILDALNALVRQTYKNLEIIVVDNGSSDGTSNEIKKKYPNCNLIILSSNLGCEEGFNVGMVNSNGDILIFLDSDAYFEDDGIFKIIEKFKKNDQLGIIDPRIYNYYSKKIQNEPKNWPPSDKMFTGCAVGIRKTVIDKIGLRPKNFFIYASEADISIRALDAGFLIEHCEDIEAFHKESPVKRLSPKFYYYNTRNIIWLILKYYPIFSAIREILIHLCVNFTLSIKSFTVHYYIKGLVEGIIMAPQIIKNERKPLKKWYLGRIYPSFPELYKILNKKYCEK